MVLSVPRIDVFILKRAVMSTVEKLRVFSLIEAGDANGVRMYYREYKSDLRIATVGTFLAWDG